MIPFRDNIPSRTFPIINILLIVLNVIAFFFELTLSPRALDRLIATFGVVPAYVYAWPSLHDPVTALVVPFFTSMFLHGGWMHLLGNMLYLWIFGDNVEDRLGHFRYLIFYLLCGLAAGIVQTAFSGPSRIPSIGASGAIAGVLGAYVVSYPFAKVLTLVPIVFFFQIIELPAILVLGFWFIVQFFSGTASLAVSSSHNTGGVAWWAHVGGFLFGMALLAIMAHRPRYDYSR
jgi:membrane associated rhomboid family serine protease